MLFKKPRSKEEIITKFSDIKKDNLYRQNYVKSDLNKKKGSANKIHKSP